MTDNGMGFDEHVFPPFVHCFRSGLWYVCRRLRGFFIRGSFDQFLIDVKIDEQFVISQFHGEILSIGVFVDVVIDHAQLELFVGELCDVGGEDEDVEGFSRTDLDGS